MNPFFTHQIRVISDHPSVGMYRRLPNREGIIAPPTKGAGARSSPRLGSDFDTKMVIILGALLCSLLAALGLNSIIRCALRFRWRLGLETREQAVARIAATGLRKKDLRRIPVGIYGSSAEIPATECSICLGEFVDGEKVRVLPMCNHGFHVRCIDTWLGSHSSCPTCRHSLIEQKAGSTSGSGSGSGSGAAG